MATATDVAVEQLLVERLTGAFSDIGILGEEGGLHGSRERFWVLDPICGTTNFAVGLPFFNVNVALVEAGQVNASVVMDGTTRAIYWTERGGGAYLGDRRLRASATNRVVHIDYGHNTATGKVGRMAGIQQRIMARSLFHVRVMATSLVLAWIAGGRMAAHVVEAIHPWDLDAGALLAEEAGAIATDLDGRPWRWDGEELLAAATPEIHRELLEVIRATS